MKKEKLVGIVLVLAFLFLVPSGVLAAPPVKVNYVELVVVDGTGAVLGTFLSYQHMPPSLFAPPIYSELVYMNSNGYVISLEDVSAGYMYIHEIFNLYYESFDCTGPAHVQAYRLTGTVWTFDDKNNPGSILVGYVPSDAVLHPVTVCSSAAHGICSTNITPGLPCYGGDFYDFLPNDQSVTGVSDPMIWKPISIQRRNR